MILGGATQIWARLFASLGLLSQHLAEAVLLRGRLASAELARERRRLFTLLGWFTAAAFFGMMGVIIATFFVIALFWGSSPVVALGCVAGAYALLAVVALWRLKTILDNLPPILGETLAVLEKDYRCWAEEEAGS